MDKCRGNDDTRTEILGEPVPICERQRWQREVKKYSNAVRGMRITCEW